MTSITLSAQILRAEKDGIEFFTVQETGESGMSQSGLARACGVGESTIRYLLDTLRSKTVSEVLEPFTGKTLEDLSLRSGVEYRNVRVLKDIFCAAVITHYAQVGKAEAAMNVCAFAAAGIRTFIHSYTGWQPQSQPQQPTLPANYIDALKALVSSEEEKLVLATTNQELQAVNAELAPKAAAADLLLESGGNLTFQEAAQLIGVRRLGRNNLFKALIELKLLIDTKHPYQRYIDQGLFIVKEKITSYAGPTQQILITQKGLQYILPKLDELGHNTSKIADSFRPAALAK